jgi:23S rRNA (adenine2030-N6)-methyltransferase
VLEFLLRAPLDASRLNGCGLLAVGAPFGLVEDVAPALLAALSERLGEDGAEWRVTRVVAE